MPVPIPDTVRSSPAVLMNEGGPEVQFKVFNIEPSFVALFRPAGSATVAD